MSNNLTEILSIYNKYNSLPMYDIIIEELKLAAAKGNLYITTDLRIDKETINRLNEDKINVLDILDSKEPWEGRYHVYILNN